MTLKYLIAPRTDLVKIVYPDPLAKYGINDLVDNGWRVTGQTEKGVGLKKRDVQTGITGKVAFLREGQEVVYASWIETPDGEKLEERVLRDPSISLARGLLFGRFENYLSGAGNIKEIKIVRKKYL